MGLGAQYSLRPEGLIVKIGNQNVRSRRGTIQGPSIFQGVFYVFTGRTVRFEPTRGKAFRKLQKDRRKGQYGTLGRS